MGEPASLRQRLAAILAADAAGYSRLMANDEPATVAALDAAREVFRAAIQRNDGRLIDMAGDSVLAVFETAVGAARTALDVQEALETLAARAPEDRRMRFRVGVHLGDLIEKPDGTVYGDGVNIAARLEGLAPPGGIAVSDAVRSSVRSRVQATFEDLGEQLVKNIAVPVHAFLMRSRPVAEVHGANAPTTAQSTRAVADITGQNTIRQAAGRGWLSRLSHPWVLTVMVVLVVGSGISVWWARSTLLASNEPNKSIAVLPFVDMSERHDQEYFADGLSEELINHLTRAADLKVIARTSSFQFKGKNEDMRVIAHKLGVAHLLEGSVRRSGDALRITAQLIRAEDGTHIWSQTYDRNLKDLFAVQDDIAGTVAKSLQTALHSTRSDPRSSNMRAYNLVLEGRYFHRRYNTADIEKAIGKYKEALRLDPNYAMAWAELGGAYHDLTLGSTGPSHVSEARAAIDRALQLDPNLAFAHTARAHLLRFHDWDWQGAAVEFRRAKELEPGDTAWAEVDVALIGWSFGHIDESIQALSRYLERDPLSTSAWHRIGLDYYVSGRYVEAVNAFRKVLELQPTFGNRPVLATTLLLQGKKSEALEVLLEEPEEVQRLQVLPLVYWDLGRRAESAASLDELKKRCPDRCACGVAQVYAYRGELGAAFDWLERAYQQRNADMAWIKVDPLLRNLHGDPRFHAMLVKMKLDGDGPSLRQ